MTERINQIDVNAVNERTQAETIAEEVVPLGYEASRRLHEQMGEDMLTFLSSELEMYLVGEGIDMKSEKGQAVTGFVAYVIHQWNGARN